jgi:branched-chain amino acid transport system permease protein
MSTWVESVGGELSRHRRVAGRAVFAVVLVLLPFVLGSQITTANFVLITAIGAVGLNIVTGFAGQISLGQSFFMAAGAYSAAVIGIDHGMNGLIWIPAAGLIAAATGAIIGPSALRLRGFYLAIVTIALVLIGQYILSNNPLTLSGGEEGRAFPPVTLGPLNFGTSPPNTLGPITLSSDRLYFWFSLALLALSLAYTANLRQTRLGRAMLALRERELAAAVMGIDVARTKVAAFTISSFFAGISGVLYASYITYTQPTTWNLNLSIQFVAALIVGGIGTVYGPVLGAAVVFALPNIIQNLPFVGQGGRVSPGDISSIAYGVLIMAFLVTEPRGLAGLGDRITSLARFRRSPAATETPIIATETPIATEDRSKVPASSINPLEEGHQ